MKAVLLRSGAAMVILLLALTFIPTRVLGSSDDFRFKWPYRPGVVVSTTTTPYTDGHANSDAWDFVIGGAEVVSSAEGTVTFVTPSPLYDPYSCNPVDGGGFGNNVLVEVPTASGQNITIRYAHLASLSVILNQRVLQGGQIGIEGETGHTIGIDAPGYPVGTNNCGIHLHIQFNPARPTSIDGQYVGSGATTTPGGPSTNSIVGTYTAPGAAIQQKYFDLGSLYTSWATVGWTADWTSNESGCGSVPYCRLYVHFAPDAVVGHWGSLQVFRQGSGTPVTDDSALMVGRWAVNDAHWLKKGFFAGWLGSYRAGGLPAADEVIPGTTCGPAQCCSVSVGCQRYQRLHVGYIWEHQTNGVQPVVFCPDVAATDPGVRAMNYVVNIYDVQAEATHFGSTDAGLQPYESFPNEWYDVNGDGVINVNVDILETARVFGRQCWAGGQP